jgi:hypothetical protein
VLFFTITRKDLNEAQSTRYMSLLVLKLNMVLD